MTERIKSFLSAVIINMILRPMFLALVLIIFAAHWVIGLPLWYTLAAVLVWVIYGAIVTAVYTYISNCHSIPEHQKGISLHPGRNRKFDKMYGKDTGEKHDSGESE